MAMHQISGISIVIPTYNRADLLRPTLESVTKISIPDGVPVELLVIDNRCTDATPQVVEAAAGECPFPVIRIFEEQQGLCYGRNRGLKDAKYSEVVFLDDDIEVADDWLLGYIDAVRDLDADCVVGPVTPKFEMTVPEFLTPRVLDSINSSYSQKGDAPRLLAPDVAHEVPGCNFGVRKSVAFEIGEFSKLLGRVGKQLLAGEDTEFGMRLSAAGKHVAYHPRCAIRHMITKEKLSRNYLRKRWSGLGATQELLEALAGRKPSLKRRGHLFLRAVRLRLRSWRYQLMGNAPLGFENELESRRLLAYVRSTT